MWTYGGSWSMSSAWQPEPDTPAYRRQWSKKRGHLGTGGHGEGILEIFRSEMEGLLNRKAADPIGTCSRLRPKCPCEHRPPEGRMQKKWHLWIFWFALEHTPMERQGLWRIWRISPEKRGIGSFWTMRCAHSTWSIRMERCALGKEQTRAHARCVTARKSTSSGYMTFWRWKAWVWTLQGQRSWKRQHGQCVAMGCSKERWKTPDSLLRQRGFGGWRRALCECDP